MLLHVAGEDFEGFNSLFVPQNFLQSDETTLQIKCRQAIRKHLKELGRHTNLFTRIAQLPLPTLLKSFLLFNKLDTDES